jgi:hypothetical protein
VSAGASAGLVNLTVTDPSGPGYVTAYPCGEPVPPSSNVNFRAGQTVANLALIGVGSAGSVCVSASVGAQVIVDVNGWTAPAS